MTLENAGGMNRTAWLVLLIIAVLSVASTIWLAVRLKRRKEEPPGTFSCVILSILALTVLIIAVAASMYFLHVVLMMHRAYWLVPVFGALGGLVGSLMRKNEHLVLVRFDPENMQVRLGFVGDMILGLGGASAVVFLFDNTLQFNPEAVSSYPLLVSICFLAGVFGKLVVERAGSRMLEEALATAKTAQRGVQRLVQPSAMAYVLEAREQIISERFSEALASAQKALDLDPANIRAFNAKARALKRLGQIRDAYETVNEALRLPMSSDPNSRENRGVLIYNRVCYGILVGALSPEEAISELRRSFEFNPKLRDKLNVDSDLEALRPNEEFQRLMTEKLGM